MGETQNTFKQRISQHLDDIYNFIPFRRKFDKEVAVHFNLKGHNYLNDNTLYFETEKDLK